MVRLLDCSKESVQVYSTERKIVRLLTYTLFEEKRFIYNGEQLIAELDGDNNIQKEYIWGNDVNNKSSLGQTSTGGVGALVGLKVHNSNNTISSYAYISDNMGNIVALVDKKGKLVNKYSYTPFGKQNIIKEDIEQSFGFNTKLHDDTGLIYYNNRYYNADLGRFITRDPIREVGGSNLYNFVGNDPVNNWDTLGLCGKTYLGARDLAGGLGAFNHQFIVSDITDCPELKALYSQHVKIINERHYIITSAGNDDSNKGKLTSSFDTNVQNNFSENSSSFKPDSFIENDWQALEDYLDKKPNENGWDTELVQIPSSSVSNADILSANQNYANSKMPLDYNLLTGNSNSFTTTILYFESDLNVDELEDLTDFSGIDIGEDIILWDLYVNLSL